MARTKKAELPSAPSYSTRPNVGQKVKHQFRGQGIRLQDQPGDEGMEGMVRVQFIGGAPEGAFVYLESLEW